MKVFFDPILGKLRRNDLKEAIAYFNSMGIYALIEVANYSALPDPTTVHHHMYVALASQGTSWLPGSWGGNYYPEGYYYSDGTQWIYAKTPYQALQVTVDAGLVDNQFVSPLTFNNAAKWNTKVSSVTGPQVDNTDPLNPIINTPTPIALRGYVSGGNFTTTSLTLVDITGLSVALAANSIYEFDIKLTYESSSNQGLNTGVNFSAAGATIEAGEVGARDAEVGKVVRLNAFNTPHATAAWLRTSTTPQTHEIKGIVRTGANAGNLTAQILKVGSGTATVYIDSYIRAQKV